MCACLSGGPEKWLTRRRRRRKAEEETVSECETIERIVLEDFTRDADLFIVMYT